MIPKTFIPKKEGNLEKLLEMVKDQEGLVISVMGSFPPNSTELYVWSPSLVNPIKIKDFGFYVYALQFYDNDIFAGGGQSGVGIITRLLKDFHMSREQIVLALCSYEGKLYDGGSYAAVYETLKEKLIVTRNGSVNALCSSDGKLLDGGNYAHICSSLEDKFVYPTGRGVMSIFFDGSETFVGIFDKIVNLENEHEIPRPSDILTLGAYQGIIYDGGRYPRIYKNLSEEDFFEEYLLGDCVFRQDKTVTSIVPAPFWIIEELLDRKFRGRL